ncbi:L-fucose:H+ symporter permease [Filimonas effusa]|uniref:L-fucose:H+ symporter permease n=1 Tax=Filimonas effusa TaxID=2508721 RepID=A0A4Q1D967_9BACT|nr:L-fucose:H+ symporter permease [Filimonas effusa]RXK85914.1 L-fucose:H+ symporter permease [Filimonas effusa]
MINIAPTSSASSERITAEAPATTSHSGKAYLLPLVLITSLFFLWGMANNLNDILIKQFKKSFSLNDFQSGLVQSAFYLGYFVFALPASYVMKKRGYKSGIISGLLLYAAGALLFVPAAKAHSYTFFLFALFVIASGLAFLETAANPYVAVLGKPETASFRLNLAQAFNPIGCITGIVVGQQLIFSGIEYTPEQIGHMDAAVLDTYYRSETAAVAPPYLCIGIVVLLFALLFAVTRFPALKEPEETTPGTEDMQMKPLKGGLPGIKQLRMAVIAQFFCVGAQVCMWSYLIRYVQHVAPSVTEKQAANYLILSLVLFAAGRFTGTVLLKKFKDHVLLFSYALISMALVIAGILLPGSIGIAAFVATSFFMSIMYPTIFTLGIAGLGARAKMASSVIVMAIIGGAILTMIMGRVSDMTGITGAFCVPMLAFAVVAWYGWKCK